MPLRPFKFIPTNIIEWSRYFQSVVVQPSPDTVTEETIQDGEVTFPKIQNVTPDKLLGRDTSPAGQLQEISVSGGLEFTGSGGIQRSALSGDITAPAGSGVTTLRQLLDTDVFTAQTAAELAALVTPTNYYRAPGNVLRYGADPTETNDSAAAFQAAFDQAWESGSTVYIPAGEYRINSSVKIRPRITVRGDGIQTVISSYCTNEPCIEFVLADEVSGLGPHGVLLERFRVDGTNHTGTDGGIYIESSGHAMQIRNLWCNNFNDANQYGITARGDCYYVSIDSCNFQGDLVGIDLDGTGGGVNNVIIRGCKVTTCDVGISLVNAPITIIQGSQIEACAVRGIDCQSDHVLIEGCWLEQNVEDDIRFSGCSNSHARNLYTFRNPADDNYSINFDGADFCSVREAYFNNRDTGSAKNSVFFDASDSCRVIDCQQDISGDIHNGTLGSNVVEYETLTQGRLRSTQYPSLFEGGIHLRTDVPLNVQDGVVYSAGEGLIQRVNSADYAIPALQRKMVTRASVPATGTWVRGDIAWSTVPSAGGSAGWICTVGGTPGTWVVFAPIKSGSTYTPTNVTPDHSYDANATTTDELADVLGTLIADLQAAGIIS